VSDKLHTVVVVVQGMAEHGCNERHSSSIEVSETSDSSKSPVLSSILSRSLTLLCGCYGLELET